jgi:putative SOS response-associated peptidase YedK
VREARVYVRPLLLLRSAIGRRQGLPVRQAPGQLRCAQSAAIQHRANPNDSDDLERGPGRTHADALGPGAILGERSFNRQPDDQRAESIAEKPAFKNAFRNGRRCLVLADGYYEWATTGEGKAPVRFFLQSGEPFAFAGLWERWYGERDGPLTSATIITCPANDLSARVHDRMPVILRRGEYDAWLEPGARLERATSFLVPFPDAEMRAYAVSRRVNSPANDTPDVIVPIAA